MAHLKRLHTSLDDRDEDRLALVGLCEHVGDLVQEATEERGGHVAGSLRLRQILSSPYDVIRNQLDLTCR